MYLIEIRPEEKRIGITFENGCGIEMHPNELRALAEAYKREDWAKIKEICSNALSF
jgi:hypothetical protein